MNNDMTKPRRLLMLTATEHEIPFILAAKKMGFFVITTNNRPDYVGHKYADQYVYADFSEYDKMVELCKKLNIDALSWGCSDPCALAACYIGEKLGLKGHDSFENGQIIHLKDKFKEFSAKYSINTPLAHYFDNLFDALHYEINAKYPVIIKPADLAGGKGVHIANNSNEYEENVKVAFSKSYKKRIVVEPYIKGTLHSLNTFIVDGKVKSYCTANDYSYLNKYMTNTGVSPADNWQIAVKYLIPEVERIAMILGLVDGQLHLQYIMQDNGYPVIIEMMRRNIGNFWSSMIADAAGVNWPEWVIRAEAGMDCHAIPANKEPQGYYGYHMMMAPRNGIFREVTISPEFKKHIYQFILWHRPGYEVSNYLSDKLGNVLFHFTNEEEKRMYMHRINELVKIEMD